MPGKYTGYPSTLPTAKKARTNRGRKSKSHDGTIQAPNAQQGNPKIITDITPDDYIEIIESKSLSPGEKLPQGIMTKWKSSNGTDNFTKRIKQGEEMHMNNPGIRYMKERYKNLPSIRKGEESKAESRSTSQGSIVMVEPAELKEVTKSLNKLVIQDFPSQIRNYQGTIGNTDDNGNIQKLNKLTYHPEHFSFLSHRTFISPGDYQKGVEEEEIDEDKDVDDLDLEDKMHPGIFTGAARFHQSTVHYCQLCGFKAHNPSFFCVVNSYGMPPDALRPSTEDYMVTQLTDKFDFLKNLTKEQRMQLKKEVKQLIKGGTEKELSEMSKQVMETLENFKNEANSGAHTRVYAQAQEVKKICAGCAGIIHGKVYWQEVEYENLNYEKVSGYKVTSEWRNQFKISTIQMGTVKSNNRNLKRAIRCLNSWIDSKICWGAFRDAVYTTKQIHLLQRGADWMTPLGGANSKVNMVYICTSCEVRRGSIKSNGWYLTSSAIVLDPYSAKLTKLLNPRWKCPFCGAKYSLVTGARALAIDDRESPDDGGEV